jgi:hypothetical protein
MPETARTIHPRHWMFRPRTAGVRTLALVHASARPPSLTIRSLCHAPPTAPARTPTPLAYAGGVGQLAPLHASSFKLYPARSHPICTALRTHHPGSSTGSPPDADLRCRWHFCSLDLRASPSYSSHGSCAAAPTDREFGAHPHAHCFYILDASLYLTLVLRPHSESIDLAPHMHRARTSTSTVHLARTVPTSVLHASHATPPLTRPCIRVGLFL